MEDGPKLKSEHSPRSRRSRTLLLAIVLLPLVGWLLNWGWRKYEQWASETESFMNCESDYLSTVAGQIRSSSPDIQRPRTLQELKVIHERGTRVKSVPLSCPTAKLPYEWSDETLDLTKSGIAVWDPKPHGASIKFRNIVMTNGDMKRIGESEFLVIYASAKGPK